jgi:hypothetical protein
MAKETTIALLIDSDTAEGTTLARERDGLRVLDFRRERLAAAAPTGDAPPQGTEPPPEKEEENATERLRTLCAGATDNLHVGLASADLLMRIVNLPNAPADELRAMAQLQLDKISPFPVEDMTFSLEVLTSGQDLSRVLMVAVRRAVADELKAQLARARLTPQRIDVAVMGWWTLLRDANEISANARHAHLIVQENGTDMLVADNGELMAVRNFLPRHADASAENWSRDTAAEIQHALMAVELEHGPAAALVATVWQSAAADELRTEDVVALCGAATAQRSLQELPPVSEGLARRAAGDNKALLDLIPDLWRVSDHETAVRRRIKKSALGLLALWVALMATVYGGSLYEEKHVADLRVTQAQWTEPANEARDLRQRIRTMRTHLDQKRSFLECFREIVRLMPDGVTLSRVTFEKNLHLEISGFADHVNQIYEYKTRIDESTLFPNSDLKGPNLDPRTKKQNFVVKINFAPATEEDENTP